MLIYGRKPVLEALNSNEEIERIYLLHGQKGDIINSIRIAAKNKGINCTEIPFPKFKSLVKNQNAQGIVAIKSEIKYIPIDDLIDIAKTKTQPIILILDRIQDTHNLGAILRTAECAGVDGVIITVNESAPINETVIKTSTGAVEHLKISRVKNLIPIIQKLKDNGFWIVGSALENSVDYTSLKYDFPTALILGNEEKGIKKIILDECDFIVKIPMMGKLQSLNVSVSAGILLFKILEARKFI